MDKFELVDLNSDFPFGCTLYENGDILYPHWHKEIEIFLVKDGCFHIGVNGEIQLIEKNQLLIINGGDSHFYLGNETGSGYIFHFDIRIFQDTFLRGEEEKSIFQLFKESEKLSVNWKLSTQQYVYDCLYCMAKEWERKKEAYRYIVKAKLLEMLVTLYREVPRETAASYSPDFTKNQKILDKINVVFDYVGENHTSGITIQDTADYLGYSTSYFSNFMKNTLGMTPTEFLNGYRVNTAKWILSHEDIGMVEVAEKSGFSNVKTIHHVFKKIEGVSPLQYRKDLLKRLNSRD